LRKDTILKIITSTLIIATLFTTNITASQKCHGLQCYASFGKSAQYNNQLPTKRFNTHDNIISMPIAEPTFQDETIETDANDNANFQDIIVAEDSFNSQVNDKKTFKPIVVEEVEVTPTSDSLQDTNEIYESIEQQYTQPMDEAVEIQNIEPIDSSLDYTAPTETILVENNLNDEAQIVKLTLNQETLCKEGNEVIPCDTVQSEDSECVCV